MRAHCGFSWLAQGAIYNAFDCPHCGCQNIVGVVEKGSIKYFENEAESEDKE